jgi:hypothetical protein
MLELFLGGALLVLIVLLVPLMIYFKDEVGVLVVIVLVVLFAYILGSAIRSYLGW